MKSKPCRYPGCTVLIEKIPGEPNYNFSRRKYCCDEHKRLVANTRNALRRRKERKEHYIPKAPFKIVNALNDFLYRYAPPVIEDATTSPIP